MPTRFLSQPQSTGWSISWVRKSHGSSAGQAPGAPRPGMLFKSALHLNPSLILEGLPTSHPPCQSLEGCPSGPYSLCSFKVVFRHVILSITICLSKILRKICPLLYLQTSRLQFFFHEISFYIRISYQVTIDVLILKQRVEKKVL